jgi:protein TonB
VIRLRLRLPARGSPLARWIGLSLAGHAVFVAAVLLMPSLDAGSRVPDHVVVELVPVVGPMSSPAEVAAPQPPEPAPAPAPPPEKAEPVPILPKKPPPEPPAEPVEKKPVKKKEEKKTPPPPVPPRADPAAATATGTTGAPGGTTLGKEVGDSQGGVAALEAGDLQFAWYRSSVTAALHANWRKPAVEGVADSYLVTVAFDIRRDGTVEGLRIEQPSGIDVLDRSAIRAVRDASPLPPLPRTWPGEVLAARFVFRLYPG